SSGGSIGAGYVRIAHPNRPSFTAGWAVAAARPDEAWWPRRFDVLGFSYWNATLPANRKNGDVHAAGFAVPHALVAVLFAVPPALAARTGTAGSNGDIANILWKSISYVPLCPLMPLKK